MLYNVFRLNILKTKQALNDFFFQVFGWVHFVLSKTFYKMSASSEDPDQTAPPEQSDQGLHCLLRVLSED